MTNPLPPTSADPAEPAFSGLTTEERRQGFVTLKLLGRWDAWIKRRVEQICFMSHSAVRRQVSVDFRLHEDLFGRPTVEWGDTKLHYVPLALLDKQTFVNFDLRDEDDRALPLVTRRKNAAIGAAVLTALAKTSLVRRLLEEDADHPSPTSRPVAEAFRWIPDPRAIKLPPDLEEQFWRICYREIATRHDEHNAMAEFRRFTQTPPSAFASVADWPWQVVEEVWEADVEPALWRWALATDPAFASLAFDFSRLFMICAPVAYVPGKRRVIKFSYDEHAREPEARLWRRLKRAGPGLGAGKYLRRAEDYLEGLETEDAAAHREWIAPFSASNRELSPLSMWAKFWRGVGWVSKRATFELPAVGLGGSFHFEFACPEGTQIRRARLRAVKAPAGHDLEQTARRAARDVDRVHLYLGGLRQGASGSASVAIKPRSSTIIRGACIAAAVTAGLLAYGHRRADEFSSHADAAVALLLLGPALLAAYTARPGEHPATTSLVFGLRLLALLTAGCAIAGAALVIAGEGVALALVLTSLATFLVLVVAWRLAARGWPELPTPVVGSAVPAGGGAGTGRSLR